MLVERMKALKEDTIKLVDGCMNMNGLSILDMDESEIEVIRLSRKLVNESMDIEIERMKAIEDINEKLDKLSKDMAKLLDK